MFILILTALIEAYIDGYYSALGIDNSVSFVSMHKAPSVDSGHGWCQKYIDRHNSRSRWNHSRNTKHGKIKHISKIERTMNVSF